MKYYAPTKLSENIAETPEGFLICIGVQIARTGDQEYAKGETPIDPGSNGVSLITRDPEEVFRPQTISSFEGKPFTIKHPELFVTPENWSELAKGVVQNVRRGVGDEKDDLIADILITDSFAISLVKNGVRGLSCGYECDYIETEKGKGKQTNIVGNHVALVEEGRAGPEYAIKDHKGVFKMSKTLVEKIKAALGKTIDEAAAGEEAPPKSKDDNMYDELVKICKDLGEKIDAMKSGKDADKDKEKAPPKDEEKESKKEEEKGKDDEAGGMEERLKALEMAVAKLLDSKGEDDEEEGLDEDPEEGKDEDKKDMVGDAARAEILAPGIKQTKDLKSAALKAFYGTKEGKAVVDAFTGGKAPTFDSKEHVNMLFIAASEIMKKTRSTDLARTRTGDFQSSIFSSETTMTAEKMNEKNAAVWANRK